MVAVVGVEVVVFALLILVYALRVTFVGAMGVLAASFLATVGILAVVVHSTTRRLAGMTDQVQRQVAAGDLTALLAVEHEDELGRLATAFNQLLMANREALKHLNRRADELAMLNMLAAHVSQSLDLQEVLNVSLRQALTVTGWDAGSIYLWDERAKNFNMVSYESLPEAYVREVFAYEPGEGIVGRAAEAGSIIITDGNVDGVTHDSGLTIQLSIPLRVPGRVLGVLNLGSQKWRRPDVERLELLKTIGHQIAVALEKAQLYHKLEEHAEELEGMVEARTAALAQAIDDLSDALERAREADKVKSQLLSTVSHELRTPLATIKGHTSVLVDHLESVTPEMLREALADIEEESDKLTELIGNLLEMSRIEAGVLLIQVQALDLLDVVRSTVEAAQVRIPDRRIVLEAPTGRLSVSADARRVQQILDNLMNNAAKYSETGKPIVVSVTPDEDGAVVSVRDEGPGIPTKHLGHIFDRFYQVGTDKDRTHGIGLGLAICRGLVEAHGGRIWADSVPGQGSTFSFSLPAHELEKTEEGLTLQPDHS